MSKPVDLELKKAFVELQSKMLETSKKIQVIDSQIMVLRRVLNHIDITRHEICILQPETITYEAVGRMFLHTDLSDVKKNLYMRMTQFVDRKNELESNKKFLEQNLKESEDNIREMVQQRKDKNQFEKS